MMKKTILILLCLVGGVFGQAALPQLTNPVPPMVGPPVIQEYLDALRQWAVAGKVAGDAATAALELNPVFYAESYGAIANDSTDDKAAIQAAIDACEAAGGGIVQFGVGRYDVAPLATGKGLWHDGDLSVLQGMGGATEISATTSTSSAAFCLIAPRDYDNIPGNAAYGGNPIYVRNMRLRSDVYSTSEDADAGNCHDLIGIGHCPWAVVENVGFEQSYYHCFEVNVSKNVRVSDCYTYGTGNFSGSLIELDARGSMGIMDSGPPATTPIENVIIERFIQRVPRTDLTITTVTAEAIILSHTGNYNTNLKNITVRECKFIPHQNTTLATGSTSAVIAWDTGAWPGEVNGLVFENNSFVGGGLCGSTKVLDLGVSGLANIRINGVTIRNNFFDCAALKFIHVGATNGDSVAIKTSVTAAETGAFENVVIAGNVIRAGLDSNTADAARPTRAINAGPGRSFRVSNNTVLFPNQAVGAGWGTSDGGSSSYAFFFNNPQYLECHGNSVEVATLDATENNMSIFGYVFSAAGLEMAASGPLPGHWDIQNNYALGTGTIVDNLAAGFVELLSTGATDRPSWSSPSNPSVTGVWRGNKVTTAGTLNQTLSSTDLIPLTAITTTTQTQAGADALGSHYNWALPFRDNVAVTMPVTATSTNLRLSSRLTTVTGTAGGSTITTIGWGASGQTATLLFADALVTVTDTDAATANTINLSAPFVSLANSTLTLTHNGTKWFETARSVN